MAEEATNNWRTVMRDAAAYWATSLRHGMYTHLHHMIRRLQVPRAKEEADQLRRLLGVWRQSKDEVVLLTRSSMVRAGARDSIITHHSTQASWATSQRIAAGAVDSSAGAGGGIVNQWALLSTVVGDGTAVQLAACSISNVAIRDHPVKAELNKRGKDDVVVAISADRISRGRGQLGKVIGSSSCDLCILCPEVSVAAALVGWDTANPPDGFDEATPPRFLQLALGIAEGSDVEQAMDAAALREFNLRTASTVLTALRQRALEHPVLLPLSIRHHMLADSAVTAQLTANEAQDAAYSRSFLSNFCARRLQATQSLAKATLAAMYNCDTDGKDPLHKAELQEVRPLVVCVEQATPYFPPRA